MSFFTASVTRRGRSNRGAMNRPTATGHSNQIEYLNGIEKVKPRPKLLKPRFFGESEAATLMEKSKVNGTVSQNHHSDQIQLQAPSESPTRQFHSLHPQKATYKTEKTNSDAEHGNKKSSWTHSKNLFDERKQEPITVTQVTNELVQIKIGELSSEEKTGSCGEQVHEENAKKQTTIPDIKTNSDEDEASASKVKLIKQGLETHGNSFADSNKKSQNYSESGSEHSLLIQLSESLLAVLQATREESTFLRRIIADKDSQIKMLSKGKS